MKKETIRIREIFETFEQWQTPLLKGITGILDDFIEVRGVCRDIENIWNIGRGGFTRARERNEPWLTQTLGESDANWALEPEGDSEIYRKRKRRAADAVRERGRKALKIRDARRMLNEPLSGTPLRAQRRPACPAYRAGFEPRLARSRLPARACRLLQPPMTYGS